MFKRLMLNSAKSRLVEERLYEMVMDELESGNIRKGIWAKAVAKSNGNDSQAKSKYLELRVESLKDEAQVIQSIIDTEKDRSCLPKENELPCKESRIPEPEENKFHNETVTIKLMLKWSVDFLKQLLVLFIIGGIIIVGIDVFK